MLPDPSLLLLSRVQFGLTASFHYLFVPLTVGLALLTAMMDTLGVRRRQRPMVQAAAFWYRFFIVAWMAGFVTGYPLRQQLAERWGGYSEQVGAVLHRVMALEGVIAPAMLLLVAVLALLPKAMPPVWRVWARWALLVVMLAQCACIVSMNAWMQHPVGTVWTPRGAELVSMPALFLSATALYKVSHTLSAAVLTGALFALAVSAWYLWRRRHAEVAAASLRVALPLALAALALTAFTGHGSAREVMRQQPMKFAAMEAHWQREAAPAALVLLAWPDMAAQRNVGSLEVPYLMSWMATHGWESPLGVQDLVAQARGQMAASLAPQAPPSLQGWQQLYAATAARTPGWAAMTPEQRLDHAALASRPYVPTVFFAFRVMVGSGLVLAVLLGWCWWRRQALAAGTQARLALALVLAAPLPWVATLAGWAVAEVGRQPWAVHGRLATSAAVTLPPAAQAYGQAWTLALAYGGLALLMAVVLRGLLQLGPQGRVLPARAWAPGWGASRATGFSPTQAA